MKKVITTVSAFGVSLLCFVSPSHAIYYPDTTLVLEGHSRSTTILDWTDVIGEEQIFGVQGVSINQSGNVLNFTLSTNFMGTHSFTTKSDNTTYYFYLADFGIDTDFDNVMDYGVVLKDHNTWTNGVQPTGATLSPGLYKATAWDNSAHFFEETGVGSTGGIGYGEKYAYNAGKYDPMVAVASGTLLQGFTPGITLSSTAPFYTYTFSFDQFRLGTKSFRFFWGGSTCSNDGIAGEVPEPGTFMLLGSGLVGLTGMLGRRSARKRQTQLS